MQDEFDVDGAPDSVVWVIILEQVAMVGETMNLQYYTDRPENIVVENGMLKITAIQESYMGSGYTSARILSKGKFEQQLDVLKLELNYHGDKVYGLHFGCLVLILIMHLGLLW